MEEAYEVILERRLTMIETWIDEMKENHLPHIRSELSWIRERLNRGYRPPWSVTVIVSLLLSTCVGLLVAFVKG